MKLCNIIISLTTLVAPAQLGPLPPHGLSLPRGTIHGILGSDGRFSLRVSQYQNPWCLFESVEDSRSLVEKDGAKPF